MSPIIAEYRKDLEFIPKERVVRHAMGVRNSLIKNKSRRTMNLIAEIDRLIKELDNDI